MSRFRAASEKGITGDNQIFRIKSLCLFVSVGFNLRSTGSFRAAARLKLMFTPYLA